MPKIAAIGNRACRLILDQIRPQDEKYWDAYKGTPKGFLRQDIAANLFKNRWGEVTAVRYPLSANQAAMESKIIASASAAKVRLDFSSGAHNKP